MPPASDYKVLTVSFRPRTSDFTDSNYVAQEISELQDLLTAGYEIESADTQVVSVPEGAQLFYAITYVLKK